MEKKRILIVEDEPIVSLSMKRSLAHMGYDSGVVTSGEEALDAVGRARPDLILMDIRLKGKLDGIETAIQVIERHRIPVVCVTAYDDSDIVQRIRDSGCFGYLSKPFDEDDLRQSITAALTEADRSAPGTH